MKKKEEECKFFWFCWCHKCECKFYVELEKNEPNFCPICSSKKLTLNNKKLESYHKGI